MANRTYRYFKGAPLYAFGHGLSYTTFSYENPTLAVAPTAKSADATQSRPIQNPKSKIENSDTLTLTFTLRNTGPLDGDEVPQVYFRHVNSPRPQARLTLCAFTRVTILKNASTQITLEIPVARLRTYDTAAKRYTVEPGDYELLLAASSADIRATLPFRME
jgi:beta-glucosidase